jgi:hypothetical protein
MKTHYNIVYNNGGGGILISSYDFPTPREKIKIVNNVCYNNKHGGDALVEDSIIRNNTIQSLLVNLARHFGFCHYFYDSSSSSGSFQPFQ